MRQRTGLRAAALIIAGIPLAFGGGMLAYDLGHRREARPAAPDIDPRAENPRRARIGSATPDIALELLDGERHIRLSEMRGRPVLIAFGSCT